MTVYLATQDSTNIPHPAMFAVPLPLVFIPIKLWSPIQQLQKLHQLTTPTCKHASLSSSVAIAFDYPTRNYLIIYMIQYKTTIFQHTTLYT